jgi:hypothetical protein
MSGFQRLVFPAIITAALGFRLATVIVVRPAPVIDEAIHLTITRQFGPGLPDLAQLRDYPAAVGPLFYVLFGNLGALFAYDMTVLRLAVFALAIGSLVLFWRVLKRVFPIEDPKPALALLATAPYFPTLAGVYMTEHLALLFGLTALLCYLRFRDAGKRLDAALSLLAATFAIYTRNYFIFLPAAFAVTDLISPRSRARAALWLLPTLAFLPTILVWRGLAPPTYQHMYHPGFQWQNAGSLFVWTGVFFLPWVWRNLRPWHLGALLAIPVVLLAPLPGLGFTRSALKLLPHPLAVVAACGFAACGLAYLIRLVPQIAVPALRVAAIGALLLVTGLIVSGPAVYERYLLPGIPLMLVCARPGTRPGLALAWGGLFQLPLAIAHTLHLCG